MVVVSGKAATHAKAAEFLESAFSSPAPRNVSDQHQISRVIAEYRYTDEEDSLLWVVERLQPKQFRQKRLDAKGGWLYSLNGTQRVPYRLRELLAAVQCRETIFVVEGEKDVDRLRALGAVATTNAGGAAFQWPPEWVKYFKGAAQVVVIADNDGPGLRAARERARLLATVVSDVRLIESLPNSPDKGGDVSDYLDGGGDLTSLMSVVAATPRFSLKPPAPKLNLLDPVTIKIEPVTWFLDQRAPFAEVTMFDGDGGVGKTTIHCDLAAKYSAGKPLPDGSQHEPGNVLIIAEEDRDSTLRAKLQVAGADFSRIRFLKSVGDDEHRFTLPSDADSLRAGIEGFGARLVIIDAIFNHLDPTLQQNKSQDVRTALMPLGGIAHNTGAAILATRHLGKTFGSAGNRGLGSVDIKNVCRSVLTIGQHRDDETTRVIAVAKTNLGMPCEALTYRLEPVSVTAEDGSLFSVPRVIWTGTADIRADSLTLSPPDTDDEKSAVDDASDRIIECLASGRKTAVELRDFAIRSGVRDITFRRARKRLHDAREIHKTGGGRIGGPVMWELADNRISPEETKSHIQKRDSIPSGETLLSDTPKTDNTEKPSDSPWPNPCGFFVGPAGAAQCVRCHGSWLEHVRGGVQTDDA